MAVITQIKLCGNGKYCREYENKTRDIFNPMIVTRLSGLCVIMLLTGFALLDALKEGEDLYETLMGILPPVLFIAVIIFPSGLLAYFFDPFLYEKPFRLCYEMDENGIRCIRAGLMEKRLKKMKEIFNNRSIRKKTADYGIKINFAEAVKLKVIRKKNTVRISHSNYETGSFYIGEKDLEFVLGYIKEHSPKLDGG